MSIAVHSLDIDSVDTVSLNGTAISRDPLEDFSWLPCSLTLELPVVRFTIADLLALKEGSVVETACHHTSDVPLRANGMLIGWTEFEVVGDRLAVRITEQA